MLPFAGSSPRVRGLTTGASPAPAPCRDHPRGCGAHTPMRLLRTYFVGSSPRVRGSRWCCSRRDMFTGIIPAGAGLTALDRKAGFAHGDHPRGCGAHVIVTLPFSAVMGSSPRVRGSRIPSSGPASHVGIIPAGAGLTEHDASSHSRAADHPRGCGAHLDAFFDGPHGAGSSPRVRGSPHGTQVESLYPGIIPAGAGLTFSRSVSRYRYWDHPRGCGAHPNFFMRFLSLKGSSPRVRGSPSTTGGCINSPGIIPAGAGLTTYRN